MLAAAIMSHPSPMYSSSSTTPIKGIAPAAAAAWTNYFEANHSSDDDAQQYLETKIIPPLLMDPQFIHTNMTTSANIGSPITPPLPSPPPPSSQPRRPPPPPPPPAPAFCEDHNHNNIVGANGNSVVVEKKLSHNASERNRRKKINCLYSSLCKLLPAHDSNNNRKKLSVPETVSRVLKYIPELQKEVKRLNQTKQLLSSARLRHLGYHHDDNNNNNNVLMMNNNNRNSDYSSTVISATPVGDGEMVIQISSSDDDQSATALLSSIVETLEQEGLTLLNSSYFAASAKMFYSMHVQVQGNPGVLEIEILKEKLLSVFQRGKLD